MGPTVQAQWRQVSNGWQYGRFGKVYVYGQDLPPNPHCPCNMCTTLVRSYMQTHPDYRPPSLKHLWPNETDRESITRHNPTVIDEYNSPINNNNASVDFQPMPQDAVDTILDIIQPPFDSVILDPGCGDARILTTAAEKYRTRGVGIEINLATYSKAKSLVESKNLSHRIKLYQGDCRNHNFMSPDYVILFLFDDLIYDIAPKLAILPSGTTIVSYMHPLPTYTQKIKVGNHEYYIWKKP